MDYESEKDIQKMKRIKILNSVVCPTEDSKRTHIQSMQKSERRKLIRNGDNWSFVWHILVIRMHSKLHMYLYMYIYIHAYYILYEYSISDI